jgi:hypothetical protein
MSRERAGTESSGLSHAETPGRGTSIAQWFAPSPSDSLVDRLRLPLVHGNEPQTISYVCLIWYLRIEIVDELILQQLFHVLFWGGSGLRGDDVQYV